MPSAELTTLYVGPDHCTVMYRNLLVMVVHEDPRPDLPQHQDRWVERLQQGAQGPIGFMVVLRPDNPPPKEQARATIRQAFQRFGESMSFGAIVVEKSGFTAAAQRSALSLIMMAARPRYPLKVFATVDEACRWIVSKFGQEARLTVADLGANTEAIKSSYDAGTLRP